MVRAFDHIQMVHNGSGIQGPVNNLGKSGAKAGKGLSAMRIGDNQKSHASLEV